MIVDKRHILGNLDISALNLTLELGCGQKKRFSDSVGVDQLDFDSVDIVGDAIDVLNRFPDQSVSRILSSHFFEHVEDLMGLVTECSRVLVTGGTLDIVVPHFSNPYFYSDYTHKRFFGLYTFSYLCDTPCFRRVVPRYGNNIPLTLTDVYLNFRSERPFYFRHAFGRIFSLFINSSIYLKEFYEINLCYLFHCHEIKFVLKKNPVSRGISVS
jgi:hypothetical protein